MSKVEKKINENEKKDDGWKRKITGIVLLLSIIPFFVISGLPIKDNIWMDAIHFIFSIALMTLFIYGVYEASIFVFPTTTKRKEFNIVFPSIVFPLGIVLFLWMINFSLRLDVNLKWDFLFIFCY